VGFADYEARRPASTYELMAFNNQYAQPNRPYYIQSSFMGHPRAIQDDYLVEYNPRERHNSLIFVPPVYAAQPDHDAHHTRQRYLPHLRQPQAVRCHTAPTQEEDEELQQVRLHEFDEIQEGRQRADVEVQVRDEV
jgi:hypothetical protein